jgi:methionine aminopeptidase
MKSKASHIATIPSLPVSHDAESFTNTKKQAKNETKKSWDTALTTLSLNHLHSHYCPTHSPIFTNL